MNILYHHRIASKDGQYVHVEEVVTALRKLGHTVTIVGPAVSENAGFGHDGGWVSKLKATLPKFIYEALELTYSGWLMLKLTKNVIKLKPDAIYERYNLYQPAGIIISKIFRLPLLLEVNAPLYEERSRYAGGIAMPWLAKAIERFTWRNATKVFPVSQVLADIVGNDIDKHDHIKVIHNGIRASAINEFTPAPWQPGNEIVIGFVGFMHLTCGVEQVLSLMAKHRELNVRLVCIGDGPRADALKIMAKELSLENRTEFQGLVVREGIFAQIKRFHIALQPAVTAYASPLKMFEYMAASTLIVAPDQPNIKEILNTKSALFFNPGDNSSFSDTLLQAISDYETHQDKRHAARKQLLDNEFSWEANASRIIDAIPKSKEQKVTC